MADREAALPQRPGAGRGLYPSRRISKRSHQPVSNLRQRLWAPPAGEKSEMQTVGFKCQQLAFFHCFYSHLTGAAHHCEADPDGAPYWKRAIWRGVARSVAGGEGSSQSVLYSRGGQLVQRDGDISDCPHET